MFPSGENSTALLKTAGVKVKIDVIQVTISRNLKRREKI
jgi:hypothetical protein